MIGNNEIRSGAFNRSHDLKYGLLLIPQSQFRAMFTLNCRIDNTETLRFGGKIVCALNIWKQSVCDTTHENIQT